MKKDQNTILSEFVSSLSEDDLRFVASRLSDRYSDDVSDVLDFLSKHKRIDGIFRSTNSAYELYDLCDEMAEISRRECNRRKLPPTLNITAA